MIGTVNMQDQDHFTFRLLGTTETDLGLESVRRSLRLLRISRRICGRRDLYHKLCVVRSLRDHFLQVSERIVYVLTNGKKLITNMKDNEYGWQHRFELVTVHARAVP